jgi:hypothetical protein
MTYLKIVWTHSIDDEPIELLYELDFMRNTLRTVEVFRNGVVHYAGPKSATGSTQLSERPLPTNAEIVGDSQFRLQTIDREVFEQAWQSAIMASAA